MRHLLPEGFLDPQLELIFPPFEFPYRFLPIPDPGPSSPDDRCLLCLTGICLCLCILCSSRLRAPSFLGGGLMFSLVSSRESNHCA